MHFRKCGLDIVTSAVVRYQLWFGGQTHSKEHFDNFIITFLFSIAAGQTVFKTHTCVNAKR
jgi:hypothetical protein